MIKAYWLRSEIEKLEGEKWDGKEWIDMMNSAKRAGFSSMKSPEDFIAGKNHALTSIITRYKEELLELEKGV